MFSGVEFIRSYINNLLIITKLDWYNHFKKLKQVLQKLKENGLKYDIEKLIFGKTERGYLGFCVTRTGIQHINKN